MVCTQRSISFGASLLQVLLVVLLGLSNQCYGLIAVAPVSNDIYRKRSTSAITGQRYLQGWSAVQNCEVRSSSLEAVPTNEDNGESRNSLYRLLATSRDNPPGSEFFYNDEVISHLHGYMFLIGGLAAHDETFFFSFLVLASAAAGGTLIGALPANPRIPGIVAALTLILTGTLRYIVGYEPMLFASQGYIGPDDSALQFEIAVCALNVGWGLLGSWRTKEPSSSGATTGF